MNHVYHECQAPARCGGCRTEGLDCMYAVLSVCKVCGGSEGSLLPFCPERRLTHEEDQKNYVHYCAGTGPFARANAETVEVALGEIVLRIEQYKSNCLSLRDAVWELWLLLKGVR